MAWTTNLSLGSGLIAALMIVGAACGEAGGGTVTEDDDQPGGGGSAGSATTTGSGAGPTTQTWRVGFIAETEPGRGPAALRFVNESTGILSGVLRETTFWQVAPDSEDPWQIARSADVQVDAVIGYHDSFSPQAPCSFLPVTIAGVSELVPGQGYLFRVFDDGDSYGGEIVDDEVPAPFTGLRAFLGSPLPAGAALSVTLEGASEPLSFDLLQSEPTVYQRLDDSSVTIGGLTLTSPSGDSWLAAPTVSLDGAAGFTIYVGYSPPEDALEVVDLAPPG